jgi:acyl carrier protein
MKGNAHMSMTATEATVAAIWSHELQMPDVQSFSDFFALGGDSLKMLNILYRINEIYRIDIPPGVLFEGSTLGEFCRRIDSERASMQQEATPVNIDMRDTI